MKQTCRFSSNRSSVSGIKKLQKKVVSLHNTTDDLKTASTSIVDLLTNKLIALNLLKSENIFFHKIIMLMNRNLFHLKSWSLIVSDSVRKARGGNLIDRGQTLEPLGLNWRDETWHFFHFFILPVFLCFFRVFLLLYFSSFKFWIVTFLEFNAVRNLCHLRGLCHGNFQIPFLAHDMLLEH